MGTSPGQEETAEKNYTSRSAKGNKYVRRILNQTAHATVKKKGNHFQAVFRRLLSRLGCRGAIWAIAHRVCRLVWNILHEQLDYIEQGQEPDPRSKPGGHANSSKRCGASATDWIFSRGPCLGTGVTLSEDHGHR